MTKLTTERLEKLQDDLLQFQDHYSDPADKENYDIFVDALHMLDEFKAAKEKLMAYEQAAKKPIGSFHISGGQVEATTDYCRDGEWPVQDGEVLVYAAPVLPKQPELVENLKKVMNSWLAMEPKLAYQPEFTDVMMLLDAEAAPAQPVIPEQAKPEFYTKPDRFLPECLKPEDISGESRNSRIAELMGWFDRYYNGKANPKWLKPHVAELCYYILTVPQLSAQPVSEPYKLPSGWKLVPIEPTAAMFHAFNDDDYGRKSMRERYIQMIEAAPAQESE